MMILDKTKPYTIIHDKSTKGRYVQNGVVFAMNMMPVASVESAPVVEENRKPSMMTFSKDVVENEPLPEIVPKENVESVPEPEEKKKGRIKLCLADARNIRRKHAEGATKNSLVKEFKTSPQSLNKILAGTTLPEPNMPDHLRDRRGRDFEDQESIEMLPKDKE